MLKDKESNFYFRKPNQVAKQHKPSASKQNVLSAKPILGTTK